MNNGRRWSASGWRVCAALCLVGAAGTAAHAEGVLRLQAGNYPTTAETNLLSAAQRGTPAAAGGAYVLQLAGPITAEERAALAAAGVSLGNYLPDHAYLVDLAGADRTALAALPFVTWLGAYQDAWKLDPAIGNRLAPFATAERAALDTAGRYQLSVTLFPWADADKAAAELTALGVGVAANHEVGENPTLGVRVEKGRLAELAALPYVQYVEESSEVTLRNSTDRWIVQSNVPNVTPLYDHGIHGEGQIVGELDGKLYVSHCSFSDTNPIGPTHRKILAYNTSQGSDSHGTHVAGTVVGDAGVDNDTRGVAYLGKLVFNDIPSFTESAIGNSLSLHHSQGARIHTNSWGDDGTTQYNGLCRGFDLFQYNNEDDLVCLAVTNLSSLKNPENAKNLLAVGASEDTPTQGNHCSGGTGPTADGRRKPEIYAPGCGTISAASGTACGTSSKTGTSMATPAISGTAMLVRQYYMEGFYPDGAANPADAFVPTGALIKATLLNSAVDMTGVSGYPSNQEGWGRVLADNAVYFVGDARKLIVLADLYNANGMTTGQTEEYQFSVSSSAETLRLTMVFTDVPGTAGAGNPVVNNLDLEVVSPDGTQTYRGNFFSGGASTPGGTADAINNVEQVLINNPPTGLWTARVKATAVNQGTQGYSLVATGDVNLGPLPPVAENVALETFVDVPLVVQLIATDVDVEPLTYTITSLPVHGTLSDPQGGAIASAPYALLNGGSEVNYTPAPGYLGDDSFIYKANDGGTPPDGGDSNLAIVDIFVKAYAPQILTTALPDGQVGVAYGPEQIQLSGGQPPLTWQIVANAPYIETDLGTNGFAEVGVAQGWYSDDQRWTYNLPFAFPYYDVNYTQAYVWSNGVVDFVVPHVGNSHLNSDALLLQNRRVAPLWDDLKTNVAGDDIFIDDSVAGEVTIRWQAHTYSGSHPVNVAVTLHQSGAIDFHYGPGNVGAGSSPLSPTVGVSNGDGSSMTLSLYNNATDLGMVNSVRMAVPDQLSPGLTLTGNGQLVGVPEMPGEFLPVIRVTDSLNRSDQAPISLVIHAIRGDFDQDGDIDGDDLLLFTDCLNGPLASPPGAGASVSESECLSAFDFDTNDRVDLVDFGGLQNAMNP